MNLDDSVIAVEIVEALRRISETLTEQNKILLLIAERTASIRNAVEGDEP